MALIESLRAGAGLINDLDKNRILNSIAPYQGGLAAAQLLQANTENQFLPDKLRMANQYQGLVNQYYAPNMDSAIAGRNANTAQTNIQNQFLPEQYGLANAHQAQVNQLYPDLTKAQIDNYKSNVSARAAGGMGRGGVDQQNLNALVAQVQSEFPGKDAQTIAGAYLDGESMLPDGSPVPPQSGLIKQKLLNIQRRNAPTSVQNQAANLDVLASDLKGIDIAPLQRFSGLKGRGDYAKYVADMALGNDVPQEFRDYQSFKSITSYFAMDALRKGFGTSVVPDYVYQTLGNASNPNSAWWYDPKQVEQQWKRTTDWIDKNAEAYKEKSRHGVTADVSEKKASSQSNAGKTRTYNISTGKFE